MQHYSPSLGCVLQMGMVQHIKREHPGLEVICGNVVASWQVGWEVVDGLEMGEGAGAGWGVEGLKSNKGAEGA